MFNLHDFGCTYISGCKCISDLMSSGYFHSRLVHKVAQLENAVITILSKLDVIMEKMRLQTFNIDNKDTDRQMTRDDVSF